jgi:hypothetical protein
MIVRDLTGTLQPFSKPDYQQDMFLSAKSGLFRGSLDPSMEWQFRHRRAAAE